MKESDNNVKLIVLDRLVALKDSPQQEKILQELAMDVLRILSTPDLEVRKKTLNLGKCVDEKVHFKKTCLCICRSMLTMRICYIHPHCIFSSL